MRGDCNAVRAEEAGHMKYGESLLVTSWDDAQNLMNWCQTWILALPFHT
jgi:hypothetical protein